STTASQSTSRRFRRSCATASSPKSSARSGKKWSWENFAGAKPGAIATRNCNRSRLSPHDQQCDRHGLQPDREQHHPAENKMIVAIKVREKNHRDGNDLRDAGEKLGDGKIGDR